MRISKIALLVLLLLAGVLVIVDQYACGRFDAPVEVSSAHFVVEAPSVPQAEEVQGELERNYDRIGFDLAAHPSSPIRVHVYGNRWAYARSTGHWTASGNVEGPEMIHVLWVGSRTGQSAVHEFAHTVTLRLLIEHEPQPLDTAAFDRRFRAFPVWLWESVACFEANQGMDPMSFPYMRDGMHPSLAELSRRSAGARVYDVGGSIVAFVRTRWGQDGLIRLILGYGNTQKVLAVTEDEFTALWSDYVRAKPQ